MLTEIINKYVNNLIKLKIITKDEFEKYAYHLLCQAESVIVIVAMLLVGAVFRSVVNVIVFIICFFLIRNRAGGFHLKSFRNCFVGTLVLEIIGIVLIKYVPITLSVILKIFSFGAYIIIMMIGTLNHPNMNYTCDEYEASKLSSRVIISITMVAIIILNRIGVSKETIMFMQYAVNLSGILLCIGIITGQHSKVSP